LPEEVDIDDISNDSLKEQAEKLDLLKYILGETLEEIKLDEETHDESKNGSEKKNLDLKKSAVKRKEKRIKEDIENLKIEKVKLIREYNQKKASNNMGESSHKSNT
jgi:hypothetical protein